MPLLHRSAMLVNHLKMRSDVLSYNLGGMGCSAGVIAIGLADKLLQVNLVQAFPPSLVLLSVRAACMLITPPGAHLCVFASNDHIIFDCKLSVGDV